VELHQLRYLVAVVEEGSFTRAAARERVAQPAVSASLKLLERELGVDLLERGRWGARPTGAGLEVLAHARTALGAVAQARHVADALTGLLHGRVVVGMVVGCTSQVLAGLLADFARRHPAVEVTLVEGNGEDLLRDLRDGLLDLAWVGRATPAGPGTVTAVLYEEDQVAVQAPAADGPGDGEPLDVAGLAALRLITLPRGTGGRTALDAACVAAGVVPQIACEATGLDMVLRLAAHGLGTGIVPASVAAGSGADLCRRPLRPRVSSRIELAWRSAGPASPAGRALVEVARAHVAAAADPGRPGV
jgi:DNA-binding transcriptional LysR family regulator